MNLREFTDLKARVEQLQSLADQAEGAVALSRKRLKEECGCSSLKEAEALLAKLERSVAKQEKDHERGVREWEKTWKHVT